MNRYKQTWIRERDGSGGEGGFSTLGEAIENADRNGAGYVFVTDTANGKVYELTINGGGGSSPRSWPVQGGA